MRACSASTLSIVVVTLSAMRSSYFSDPADGARRQGSYKDKVKHSLVRPHGDIRRDIYWSIAPVWRNIAKQRAIPYWARSTGRRGRSRPSRRRRSSSSSRGRPRPRGSCRCWRAPRGAPPPCRRCQRPAARRSSPQETPSGYCCSTTPVFWTAVLGLVGAVRDGDPHAYVDAREAVALGPRRPRRARPRSRERREGAGVADAALAVDRGEPQLDVCRGDGEARAVVLLGLLRGRRGGHGLHELGGVRDLA